MAYGKVSRAHGGFGVPAGALALALSAPAFAQSAGNPAQAAPAATAAVTDSQPTEQLQEVVVTAQFRRQNVQDTPLAVTALSGAALAAKDETRVTDLGKDVPNVNISQASSLYGNSVTAFIRGIGQFSSSFALEPGVGVYIDDVYYGTTFGATMSLADLDRVEILRGPQGTLSGMNSIGGAVKLYDRVPDAHDDGYAEVTYGSYNRVDVKASAGFTITDGLYARISGVSHNQDGWFKDLDYGCVNPGQGFASGPLSGNGCSVGSEGGDDLKAVRAALEWAPADSRLKANLTLDFSSDDAQPVPTKLLLADNPSVRSYDAAAPTGGVPFDSRFITCATCYTTYSNFANGGNYTTIFGTPWQVTPGSFNIPRESNVDSYGFAGTVDYQLTDDLSLKNIVAYRSARGGYGADVDGSPLDITSQYYYLIHRQFTEELRLSGRVGTVLDYTVGGFFYHANDRQTYRVEIPTDMYDFLANDPVTDQTKSGFAHVEWHALEGLDVIGGIRVTNQTKSYTFSRTNTDGSPISGVPLTENFLLAGLSGLHDTYDGTRADWRVGVDYRWNPQLMTYVQVSTGFKGGGVNPEPFVPDQVVTFRPETLTTYEAGWKADLFNRSLRLDGALFYNDYKNIQMTLYYCPQSASTNCNETANAGDAHVKGAELEATWNPVGGLQFHLTGSYLDFHYTYVNSSTQVTEGMVAPFNNKWQGSASVEYAAPVGKWGVVTPEVDWSYHSDFYFNAVNAPTNRVSSLGLLNAHLAWESPDSRWSVSGGVTNLLNKFYYFGYNDDAVNFGVDTGMVGAPREYSVSIKRTF